MLNSISTTARVVRKKLALIERLFPGMRTGTWLKEHGWGLRQLIATVSAIYVICWLMFVTIWWWLLNVGVVVAIVLLVFTMCLCES